MHIYLISKGKKSKCTSISNSRISCRRRTKKKKKNSMMSWAHQWSSTMQATGLSEATHCVRQQEGASSCWLALHEELKWGKVACSRHWPIGSSSRRLARPRPPWSFSGAICQCFISSRDVDEFQTKGKLQVPAASETDFLVDVVSSLAFASLLPPLICPPPPSRSRIGSSTAPQRDTVAAIVRRVLQSTAANIS